jgi:hypothetical protein
MALYLVQHGRARPKSEDPLQGLSEEGAADARRTAEVAAHYCVSVSVILHRGQRQGACRPNGRDSLCGPESPEGRAADRWHQPHG